MRTTLRWTAVLALALTLGPRAARADIPPGPPPDLPPPAPAPPEDRRGCGAPGQVGGGLALVALAALVVRQARKAREAECATAQAKAAP